MELLFPLFISYAQIAVFDADMEEPFNNWNDRHVSQGFAWRMESVSFAVPDGGEIMVEVLLEGERSELSGDVSREISVPFTAPTTARVAVATIGDERLITLAAGTYQLNFQLIPGLVHEDYTFSHGVRLTFAKSEAPDFRIIKADADMNPGAELELKAETAK